VHLLRRHLRWIKPTRLTSSHVGYTVHLSSELFTITSRHAGEQSSEDLGRGVLAFANGSSRVDFLGKIGDGGGGQVIGRFTHQGVDEIGSTKSTSDQWVDVSTVGCPDFDVSSDMGKDVVVAHADESELTEVGMGSEILAVVSPERDIILTECEGSFQEA
jgi:hypothetical protein